MIEFKSDSKQENERCNFGDLPKERQLDLYLRSINGEEDIKKSIIEDMYVFARKYVRKYYGVWKSSGKQDDMIHHGILNVCERYDFYSKDNPSECSVFSYLVFLIKCGICDYIRKYKGLIFVPKKSKQKKNIGENVEIPKWEIALRLLVEKNITNLHDLIQELGEGEKGRGKANSYINLARKHGFLKGNARWGVWTITKKGLDYLNNNGSIIEACKEKSRGFLPVVENIDSENIFSSLIEPSEIVKFIQFENVESILHGIFCKLDEVEKRVLTEILGLDGSDSKPVFLILKKYGLAKSKTNAIRKYRRIIEKLTDEFQSSGLRYEDLCLN